MDDTAHHQSDSDALASALGAIGATENDDNTTTHHFHHQLQQPDFSHAHKSSGDDDVDVDVDVDVHALDIPVHGDDEVGLHGEDDLDLGLGGLGTPDDDMGHRSNTYGRPPSIRKACDLCHAAKQKCSGDRPMCTRCIAGGWQCVYAPRQRRRTVPKEHKLAMQAAEEPSPNLSSLVNTPIMHNPQVRKKRKIGQRESLGGFGSGEMDMKMAMGMAVDLGLAGEDEGDDLLPMTDEQMLESIAIDGYLADLPLSTFVHNLPYNASQGAGENFNADDFTSGDNNPFPTADMDQHTTSALRDAIFSLNESGGGTGHHEGGDGDQGDGQGENGDAMDPHLALLDLSHAMPGDGEGGDVDLNFPNQHQPPCSHIPLVPHILSLLTQQPLEPKPGCNTPLTLAIFAPLARSLRLFQALASCPTCSTSPGQTLPQLALLSRTTTVLTFPYPAVNSTSVGSSAQITLHGARLSGTGISEAIEQHIVGVVWDSWRASVREIFASLERKAQEVISQSAAAIAAANSNSDNQNTVTPTGPETQRAGLMFQAMSRLVTAMDEVEHN